jgi:large exoprotein involved in heme utilization and adhesion
MKTIHISLLLGKYSLLLTSTFLSPVALSEITLDGSMGTAGTLAGSEYQITEDLDQRTCSNLFHSFVQFNINSAGRGV